MDYMEALKGLDEIEVVEVKRKYSDDELRKLPARDIDWAIRRGELDWKDVHAMEWVGMLMEAYGDRSFYRDKDGNFWEDYRSIGE